MIRKLNLILTMLALLLACQAGAAQGVQKRVPMEINKRGATEARPRSEKVVSRGVERCSPEMERAFGDEKFLAASEVLLASGEMFLAESAQLSTVGEKSSLTFDVVNEASREPGQYRQLVYAFDGKESIAYFYQQNENYRPSQPAVGGNAKLQLPSWPPKWTPPKLNPPSWWPGSGGGNFNPGVTDYGDWKEVSTECHWTTLCPLIGLNVFGKMRQERRVSQSNPNATPETRWVLVNCVCTF
jgi:hypothetical protein